MRNLEVWAFLCNCMTDNHVPISMHKGSVNGDISIDLEIVDFRCLARFSWLKLAQ